MNNLNIIKTGNLVGILSVIFFLVCMLWGIVIIEPALKDLHIDMMRIAYLGFTMSLVGAIIGIIESFIYGWIFGALFAWLHKKICK